MKAHKSEAVLTEWQLNTVRKEMQKEFKKQLDRYNREAAMQMMYILHFTFGFGQQRLERFAAELNAMQNDVVGFYELEETDRAFFCEIKLKEAGIDVKKILEE